MIPQIYCQRDPRWAQVTLGNSKYSIGADGCLDTVIAMIATFCGSIIRPSEVAKLPGLIDMNGEIILPNLGSMIPNLRFIKEEYGPVTKNVEAALANPNQFVALELSNPTLTKTHFVWAWNRTILGDYNVADPWTGKEVLASIYKNSIGPVTKAIYFYKP